MKSSTVKDVPEGDDIKLKESYLQKDIEKNKNNDKIYTEKTDNHYESNGNGTKDRIQEYSTDFRTTSSANQKSKTIKHTSEWLVDSDSMDRRTAIPHARHSGFENNNVELYTHRNESNFTQPRVPDKVSRDKDEEVFHRSSHDEDVFGPLMNDEVGTEEELTFKPRMMVYEEPLQVAVVDDDDLLQQEVERSVKVHEMEVTDEITVETKVMEVKTVLMHMSTSGDISVTETTEIKTDTDLKETKKTREREELVMSHKTLDKKQLDVPSAYSPRQNSPSRSSTSTASRPLEAYHPFSPTLSEKSKMSGDSESRIGSAYGAEASDAGPFSLNPHDRKSADSVDIGPYKTSSVGGANYFDTSYLNPHPMTDVYIAMSGYEPESDDVMSLHEGEKLELLENQEEDWWLVRKIFDNRQGFVPALYLQSKQEFDGLIAQEIGKLVDRIPTENSKKIICVCYL